MVIHLWGGLVADFSLPVLLILVFLAGFLPMLVAYNALKWRMRQRFLGLERAIADLRAVSAPPQPAPEPQQPAQPAPPPALPRVEEQTPSLSAPTEVTP